MGFTAINKVLHTTAAWPVVSVDEAHSIGNSAAQSKELEKLTNKKRKPRTPAAKAGPEKRYRQTSNVGNAVLNTKPILRTSTGQNLVETITTPPEDAAKSRPNLGSTSLAIDHASAVSIPEVSQSSVSSSRQISVYAPTTSLDALNSTSARTSLDCVKANAGHFCTLYQNQSAYSAVSVDSANVDYLPPKLGAEEASESQPKKATGPRRTDHKVIFEGNHTSGEGAFQDDENCSQTVSQIERDESARTPPHTPRWRSQRLRDNAAKAHKELSCQTNTCDTHEAVVVQNDTDEISFSEIDDDDLVDVARHVEEDVDCDLLIPPARRRNRNMREVDQHEDYGGALLSHEDRNLLAKLSRPEDAPVPIVRKPFPAPIRDRSPLFGVSREMTLRTCFRVGECVKSLTQAARSGSSVVVELYARVTSSWREECPGRKQHFVFKDLYHDHQPHLEGTFDLWHQSELWDLDSKVFLRVSGQGIMCRLVAKMKRGEQKTSLEVLSIWEASWDDVHHVAGIYAHDS